MTDQNILESVLAEELISIITEKILKKYRIENDRAYRIVTETMEKHPKFLKLLSETPEQKKILKSRLFDEVSENAHRKIYYELRQYNKNLELRQQLIQSLKQSDPQTPSDHYREITAQLTHSHVSTKERLNSAGYFYRELFRFIGDPATIADIGCGMNPFLFPFDNEGKHVQKYVALEKDDSCISALEAYSRFVRGDVLSARKWNIRDKWKPILKETGIGQFDIALMMKLVPVISRIERDLLDVLLETPAKIWAITGSKISMTKYISIEKRERRIIHQFIERSGKKMTGEFSTDDEFCMIVT